MCDSCVNDSATRKGIRCFVCDKEVVSLGSSYSATPFWRRLKESFHYPLNKDTMILIGCVSLLTTIISVIPVLIFYSAVLYLALIGALVKYCFSCLERTSNGDMEAPDLQGAFEGNLIIILKLIAMIIVGISMVSSSWYFLGPGFAAFLTFLIIISVPAILINFAFTESPIESLNPLEIIRLISAIGLPYGLMIAFIMIMMGSVAVIHELIGSLSFIAVALQSVVSYYYAVVVFHIMGYMLFQYQGKLGYAAREFRGVQDHKQGKTVQELYHANIDIELKEGNYDEVIELFQDAISRFPSDISFHLNYFEFLYRADLYDLLKDYGGTYLKALIKAGRNDILVRDYKKIKNCCLNFQIGEAELKYQLAVACKQKGDPKEAVALLNGMMSAFPNYVKLYEAYHLMAEALDDMPNMQERAKKCREFSIKLKKHRPAFQRVDVKGKSTFAAKDLSEKAESVDKSGNEKSQNEEQGLVTTPGPENDLPPIEFK